MLRRLFLVFTAILLVCTSILPVQVFGSDSISSEGKICRDLGMLKGETGVVDEAYLQTRPNRLQAAIMFLRLKGLEEDALSYSGTRNFNDSSIIAWKQGRNVLCYLREHPELGWIGDGVNFQPLNLIDSRAYYKVLLETLGYKQKIDGSGDFSWEETLEFAAGKGLKKVAAEKTFTVNSLAVATVEALKLPMKTSGKKLIQFLVDSGKIDRDDAVSSGLYMESVELKVKSVRAISNTKVEVVFEEEVEDSQAAQEDIYSIGKLDIKAVSIKNESAVIIETSAMNESSTYTLSIDDESYSFKGLKKDSNAPKLVSAECKDTELVELTFDRILDNYTAQDSITYTIEGVTVKSARLDSTNTKVRVSTSGIQPGHSYEIKIHNIKNGDGVITKLITKRFTGRSDTAAPKLNKLTVLNNSRLLLEFSDSNGLNKASAEAIDNYEITSGGGNIDIISAEAKDRDNDGMWDSVELSTETQEAGKQYVLKIEGITDNSVLANRITKEIRKEFRGKSADRSAPVVKSSPKAITSNVVEIVFSDSNALDIESACDIDNYEIDEDLDIRSIKIKDPSDLYSTAGKTVLITTSEMEKSESYTLVIKGIRDEFENEMEPSSSAGYKKYTFRGVKKDNTPPYITSVECISSKTIELNFDDRLDKDSAENIINYRIDGLALVTKAELGTDEKTVVLTVSSLSNDKNHTILLNNIRDLSGNAMSNISVSVLYNGSTNDTDPPEVAFIEAVNENEIWVHFEEEVYAEAAVLKASGLTFKQVGNVLEDGTVVVLKPSEPMDDKEYEVTSLIGVRDTRNNAYEFESGLDFYGTDMENDPPEVENWEQKDVRSFRVVFTEPVLIYGGVSGIKNPSGVSISWTADLNPSNDETNEAYSTVDYTASKDIPAGKEYRFDFTAMVADYAGAHAWDENDDEVNHSGATILESYMEDEEDPYIEYVEAVSRNKVQVVFNEAMQLPGSYRITYWDEDDHQRTISISLTEVDSKDKTRVNIITNDEMSSEFVYTLKPISSAADIAGNKMDVDDVELDFEGSDIVTKDYIQGVEIISSDTFKISKSSKMYKVASVYELDSDGDVIGGNLIESTNRVNDNTFKVTVNKPLLRDVRYIVTADGLEYRFYGVVQNADIELSIPELEITYDGMDIDNHRIEAQKEDDTNIDVDKERNHFSIDSSEIVRNGDVLYIYVVRESDGAIIYGTRIRVGGMPLASSSKDFIHFNFDKVDDVDIEIDNTKNTITAEVPYKTDISSLVPAIEVSPKATVSPKSGVARDFSKTVEYLVTAEDGSSDIYNVSVQVRPSPENVIKEFVLQGKTAINGSIDEDKRTINLNVPFGMDISKLVPNIEISEHAKVIPASGEFNDFTKPALYTVVAQNGSTREYTVTVNIEPNTEKSITSFSIININPRIKGEIFEEQNKISLTVPFGTDRTSLVAAFSCSPEATVKVGGSDQESGKTANNFTKQVLYTVVAQDKTERTYEVTVNETPNSEAVMKEFGFLVPKAAGIIDEAGKSIYVKVPYGTDIEKLAAVFSVSDNASVKIGEDLQISGVTINNYSEKVVTYKVIAQDGTVREYAVKVEKALESEKYITEFAFKGFKPPVNGKIDEKTHTITVIVSVGTDVSTLAASFSYIGKAVYVAGVEQTSGITANDFRDAVIYTVKAPDGSSIDYSVEVKYEPADGQ